MNCLGRLKMREDSTPVKKEALEFLKRALNIRIQKLGMLYTYLIIL